MIPKLFHVVLVLLLIPAVLLSQGTTGKIKGVVKDKQSGELLIGATVAVEGTALGAASDVSGNYVVLNIPAGTYSVKASYVGYQSVIVRNIQVNTGLTTELDFSLPSTGVEMQPVEIIAERPLVNKNATNAVRITTSQDIDALPVRGLNNIIALSAGVVVQDNTVFIRGGRHDEVGYYLEGVPITNKFAGGRAVNLVQDAVQEIQVQAGGYNAEFGGANSGIIQTQLKTGTPNFHFTLQQQGDPTLFKKPSNFFDGNKTLGTYGYGYNEFTGTASGPILADNFKFFGLVNYQFNRDQTPQPYPGINLGLVEDPSTGDTVRINYPAGPVQKNSNQQFSYTGTLTADFKPLTFRLTGTYTAVNTFNPYNASRNPGIIANILDYNRIEQLDQTNGAFNLKMTHLLSPNTYYDVSVGYFTNTQNQYDPLLGDDFMHYGDSLTNAEHGVTNFASRFTRPTPIQLFTFQFNAPGDETASYIKFKRQSLSLNGGFSTIINNQHSIKIGGDYQRYAMRGYTLGNEAAFAVAGLVHSNSLLADNDPQKLSLEQIMINRGVNNYGYDVFGNETNDGLFSSTSGYNGTHHPVFAALYAQDKIEYKDLVVNLGLRYDYINTDNKNFVDPSRPDLTINKSNGAIIESGLVNVPSFSSVSPRLGLSFPVTDRTVFHTQYGKFVQQSRLRDIYQGWYATSSNIRGGFFIPTPVGFDVRPERTTQYEIGFTQQISDVASFDITGYYKDIFDQIVYDQQLTAIGSQFGGYFVLKNGDFATTKGIELTFNVRRVNRIQMNASVSFNDAQGTGSFPNSNRGIVGAPLDGVTVFSPRYVSPLEFNNAIRGDMNLDYHWGANDGPDVLHQFGGSLLLTFNSGHPYTTGIGGDNLEGDARDRQPTEPLNASTTPWNFQVDLRVDKSFSLMDRLNATVFLYVINLFDTRNVQNVFLRTGTTTDDGYLTNPSLGGKLVDSYGQVYADLYRAINIDYYEQYQNSGGNTITQSLFYGPPRQIRFGLRLEY